MLPLRETKPTFQIIAHAASQDNITHLGESALDPVLHTRAYRLPKMASVAVFDRQETVMPSLPPEEHHQFFAPLTPGHKWLWHLCNHWTLGQMLFCCAT